MIVMKKNPRCCCSLIGNRANYGINSDKSISSIKLSPGDHNHSCHSNHRHHHRNQRHNYFQIKNHSQEEEEEKEIHRSHIQSLLPSLDCVGNSRNYLNYFSESCCQVVKLSLITSSSPCPVH